MNNESLIKTSNNNTDIISTIIGVALHDPESIVHLGELIANQSITAIQRIPFLQLQNYWVNHFFCVVAQNSHPVKANL